MDTSRHPFLYLYFYKSNFVLACCKVETIFSGFRDADVITHQTNAQ